MVKLYLYGIIDDPSTRLLAPLGLGDEPPDTLAVGGPVGGFGAVVGAINGGAPVADGANVRRHLEVLEALMERCTVLPARFGSVYSGRAELDDYISDAREVLAADMARVRGHVEIGVRVTDERVPNSAQAPAGSLMARADCGASTGPGASYLAARQVDAERRTRKKRAIEALADAVIGRLEPLASRHSWKATPTPSGRPSVSLAFLVRRERFEDFRGALANLRDAEPGLEFLCTGPWPPYSFVGGA